MLLPQFPEAVEYALDDGGQEWIDDYLAPLVSDVLGRTEGGRRSVGGQGAVGEA